MSRQTSREVVLQVPFHDFPILAGLVVVVGPLDDAMCRCLLGGVLVVEGKVDGLANDGADTRMSAPRDVGYLLD
ncbi:hypothetical protein [Microlunatus elymi]|uniref:hypothetical protein n=1 Tax=Microlunatus elymi TaxID=2596828 RepID=UPI00143D5B9B|nr:hypothetical protein [Microlunatus elymi]